MILDLIRQADEKSKQSEDLLEEAKRLLELTKKCLSMEAQYLDQLPRQLIELNASIHEIEVKRSILTQVNPDYQKRYVDKCHEHALDLLKKSQELDGLFNATRDVADYALRAANAYKDIARAITEAEKAAKRAYEAAEKAYKFAVPDFDESLASRALAAKKLSYELLEKAYKLHDQEVQRLSLELAKRKQTIDELFASVKDLLSDLNAINAALKQLGDKNLMEQLLEIDAFLKGLFDRLAIISQRLEMLNNIIYGNLLPQYEQLLAVSQSSLGNMSQILDSARKDLLAAIKYGINAKLSLDKITKLEAQLDLDLDLLRRKIQLAHQEATSVRVSLMPSSATGVCERSYFVPASLSAQDVGASIGGFFVKDLSLIWSLHTEESESLLLFIGSKTSDDFISVEMYERHVRVVYNFNSFGAQVLTHPKTMDLNDNQLLSNDAWYKIQVLIGEDDTIKLSVKSMTKTHEPDSQQVSQRIKQYTSGTSTKLRITPYGEADIYFYVGGLPPTEEYSTPKQLRSNRLTGCLYDLTLNEQQIGLWNFKTNQGCDGCMEGPLESKDIAAYSFTGAQSYATAEQNRFYDRTRYMISMSVKTTDANGLLFLSISTLSNHYLSLFLSKGRIGLVIGKLNPHHSTYLGFSSGSLFDTAVKSQINNSSNQQALNVPIEHIIMTTKEYNTGKWFKLTAEKDQTRLILAVDDEYKEGNADEKLLALDMDSAFFGGVWPLVFARKQFANTSLEQSSFIGCIKDAQIETTPINLLKRQSYGVENGCPETRVITRQKLKQLLYPLPAGR